MNNPFFDFVIVIVIVSCTFKLLTAWMRSREYRRGNDESANANAALMQQRLDQLEERVQVLERIVTDDRFELKQQFKDLAR
jgi:hypothetical protein